MSEQDSTTTVEDAGTAPEETTQVHAHLDGDAVKAAAEAEQGDGKRQRGASDDLKADLVKERRQRQALEKRLKDIEDRDLTELQRAQKTAQEATTRLTQLEQESMRQRVALKAGIPAEHIHRLQGSTEDELAADAAELSKLLIPKGPRPDPSQGSRAGNGAPQTMSEWVHQALRNR